MKSRFFASAATLALMMIVALDVRSGNAQVSSDVSFAQKHPGIDMANSTPVPPPHDKMDYAPYLAPGSSQVVLRPSFTLSDGSKTLCVPDTFEQAYLFPRTKYTIWLVENWIFLLQKTGVMTDPLTEPGDYMLDKLPEYLNYAEKPNVVRIATCDANHDYVFSNVPVGTYVLYFDHVNFVASGHTSYETQQVMTPDGPHNEVGPGNYEGTGHVVDGYIAYSEKFVEVAKPRHRYTVDASDYATVVHYKTTK